MNISRILRY